MLGEGPRIRGQLKGYIFEVVIRVLLQRNGWVLLNSNEEGRVKVESNYGIEIKGRGTWHQIDSPCIFSKRIPFIYPLRLLVEAKFYSGVVDKSAIRSYIGVIRDIEENYFIDNTHTVENQKRYTDIGAFFSADGFQSEAVNLAFAHGIKTISYRTNKLMHAIVNEIKELEAKGLKGKDTISKGKLAGFMVDLETLINEDSENAVASFVVNYGGNRFARSSLSALVTILKALHSSFIGMTTSGILLHFLSTEKFPDELFQDTDERKCKIHYAPNNQDGLTMWLEFSEDLNQRRFFFDLPPGLEKVIERGGDILNEKGTIFEAISVPCIINGLLRSLSLKIDKEWLDGLKKRNRKVG